jgi:ribose transport system ATP-binding protein
MTETSADGLVRLMVGRAVATDAAKHHPASPAGAAPALEVRGLRYRGQPAGAAIDLAVARGEIVGLAGLVGCGRTETVRAIFGADRREAGTILRDGAPVRIASPRDALACGICLATEDRKDQGLILDMPVRANVTLADLKTHARKGWLQRGAEAASARAMAAALDIRLASIEQNPRELSGGNQQKVVLAKWLLRRPEVLILDEPTRGVDVGAKAEIHALLRRAAEGGMAVLVVSSDLPELLAACDRIVVLSRGRVAGHVPRRDFDEQTILQLAYREYLRNDLTDRLDRQAA